MKYRNIIALIAIALPLCASAKVVNSERALQVAHRFFYSSDIQTLSASTSMKEAWNSEQLSSGATRTLSNEAPTFFVCAPTEGKGFVIVSGDDAATPILGYSFEDEVPEEGELPCGLQWWFEAWDSQIKQMRSEGAEASDEVSELWASHRANDIASSLTLETALWSQRSPYWLQCPQYEGEYCLTGCVATAHAILMQYHKWPEMGVGSTSAYVTNTHKISVAARSLEHEYDWDNMPTTDLASYGATTEQATAVSTLMFDIGCLFQADFRPTSTSMTTSIETNGLLYEHMDYSLSMYWMYPEAFETDEEYYAALKEEIATNGPVGYRGLNENDTGHMFVLDGYNSMNYFHINWGWGDGYNSMNNKLPSITYNRSQRALMHFVPNKEGDGPALKLTSDGLQLRGSVSSIVSNKSFTISQIDIINASPISFKGSFVIGLTDEDGNIKELISSPWNRTSNLKSEGTVSYQTISCKITETKIKAGDRVRAFYRSEDQEEWSLLTPYNSYCTWEFVMTEDNEDKADLELHATWEGKTLTDGSIIYAAYDADKVEVTAGNGTTVETEFNEGTGVLTIVVTDVEDETNSETYTITFIVPDLSLYATWDGEPIEDGELIDGCYDPERLVVTAGIGAVAETEYDDDTLTLTIVVTTEDSDAVSDAESITYSIMFTISTGINSVADTQSDGPAYDLSGRRITNTAKKGVHVQDGKKILVQ